MADPPPIIVRCDLDGDDWRCIVTVGQDPDATRHDVAVTAEYLLRIGPAGTTVDELVAASFTFLLEREPRESILLAFDISTISSYFTDYEPEIRRRLGG
jgi:hypothetical protein